MTWRGNMEGFSIISPTEELPISLWCVYPKKQFRHWHEEMEMLYVLNGRMEVRFDKRSFLMTAEDVLVVNAGVVHEVIPENCAVLALSLPIEKFINVSQNKCFYRCNSADPESSSSFEMMRFLLAHIVQTNLTNQKKAEIQTKALILMLLRELERNFQDVSRKGQDMSEVSDQRLKKILTYIEEHYAEEITLGDLARQEYLSESHLSHYFKDRIGKPFSRYLMEVRLEHAVSLLTHGNLSIEEISIRCGFGTARAFNRFFKEAYHCPPTKFRKEQQYALTETQQTPNRLDLDLRPIMDHLSRHLTSFNGFEKEEKIEKAVPAERINVKGKGHPLEYNFQAIFNLGHLKNALSSTVREMVREQAEDIGFQHVFFHGILDDSLMVYREDREGNPIYNFTQVDDALSFLLSVGLTPIIQLSWMPRALSSKQAYILELNDSVFSLPKDMNKWNGLVAALLRHMISQFGSSTVRKWIFTCLNESPLPFLPDINESRKAYPLYEGTWKTIKGIDPRIAVALPSCFCQEDVSSNFLEFLAYAQEHDCPPDLYLLSLFPVQHNSIDEDNPNRKTLRASQLFTDIYSLRKFAENYRETMKGQPRKPVFITQWNCSPWHRELLNDTCFSAAYIIHNILSAPNVFQGISYIRFTDWGGLSDIQQDIFYGGTGLVTSNNIRKPNYWAFHFLSQLYPEVVSQGDGYILTRSDNSYRAIFYNYCHYSDSYANGIPFGADAMHRYRAFPDAASKRIELELVGMDADSTRVYEQIINRSHGSAFDNWINSGAPRYLQKSELAQLRMLSQPYHRRGSLGKGKHGAVYTAALYPHEIRLVEFGEE